MLLELSGRHPLLRHGPRMVEDGSVALTIDARRLRFASPLDIAGVAALARSHAHTGRPARLLVPRDAGVASYLQRMNLCKELAPHVQIMGRLPPDERSDQSHLLLELRRIRGTAEAESVGRWFATVATAQFGASARGLFRALGELLENACTHGRSEVGAFAAAQFYTGATSRRPGLELAVCDAGIGVLAHLRRNPRFGRFRHSRTALRWALREGISGIDEERRGYGLHDVLHRIGQLDTTALVLASGDAAISNRVRRGIMRTEETALASPIDGTWAWLRVRLPTLAG